MPRPTQHQSGPGIPKLPRLDGQAKSACFQQPSRPEESHSSWGWHGGERTRSSLGPQGGWHRCPQNPKWPRPGGAATTPFPFPSRRHGQKNGSCRSAPTKLLQVCLEPIRAAKRRELLFSCQASVVRELSIYSPAFSDIFRILRILKANAKSWREGSQASRCTLRHRRHSSLGREIQQSTLILYSGVSGQFLSDTSLKPGLFRLAPHYTNLAQNRRTRSPLSAWYLRVIRFGTGLTSEGPFFDFRCSEHDLAADPDMKRKTVRRPVYPASN